MNYIQILKIFKGIEDADRDAYLKLQVAKAVTVFIDMSAYDEEGFDEVCKRIYDYWDGHDCQINLSSFCIGIQFAMDEAKELDVKFIDGVALKEGWKYGLDLEEK